MTPDQIAALPPGPFAVTERDPWIVCDADGIAIADISFYGNARESDAVVQLLTEARDILAENARLREAIKNAGFEIMQTSGAWLLHDVSEYGKAEEAKSLEVANRNVDLEVEHARLREALEALVLVVGLTAFKYEGQRAVLQECVDKAQAALAARGK